MYKYLVFFTWIVAFYFPTTASIEASTPCPASLPSKSKYTVGGVYGWTDTGKCLPAHFEKYLLTDDFPSLKTYRNTFFVVLADSNEGKNTNYARTLMWDSNAAGGSGNRLTHKTTCPGATITSDNKTNKVTLPKNSSCNLTVTGASGTNGGIVEYTATLSADGAGNYSLSKGFVTGSPHDSVNGRDINNSDHTNNQKQKSDNNIVFERKQIDKKKQQKDN